MDSVIFWSVFFWNLVACYVMYVRHSMQIVVESVCFLDIVESDLLKIFLDIFPYEIEDCFLIGWLVVFRNTEMLPNSTDLKCSEIFFHLNLSYPI